MTAMTVVEGGAALDSPNAVEIVIQAEILLSLGAVTWV